MEQASPDFAAYVHQCPFNPYSQYCLLGENGVLRWRINALTDEAAGNLIAPLLDTPKLEITHDGKSFNLALESFESFPLSDLTKMIYKDSQSTDAPLPKTRVRVSFLTPTSFKSQGEYVLVPTVRLILQSLYMRYDLLNSGSKEIDEETLDYLVRHTKILDYKLRSARFANATNAGKSIPGFVGNITFGIDGPATAAGLIRMLLKFGEYSGVGIKTSMGMGAMVCG
ncbi:MAG: CRISPR-associated endoribonuclease Cas6 [Eggerthellaceae bacterium]|nr:CRISPR-associated endoribonuclease Cas6 [Eggerthellaceae bacterium]